MIKALYQCIYWLKSKPTVEGFFLKCEIYLALSLKRLKYNSSFNSNFNQFRKFAF